MEQPAEKNYTYEDYLALGENVRAELIYGDLYMMSSPSRIHQRVSFELSRQIGNFLADKPCEGYSAPFDVHLFENENSSEDEPSVVVQPDIFVVCDKNKRKENYCKGAPDLIIEILSPSSISHDRFVKRNLYQQSGVREYWIVDPKNCSAEVYLLGNDGRFDITGVYQQNDTVKVNVLDGCEIDLSTVFPEDLK